MKIARVNWAEITDVRPAWSSGSGRLCAIWPSPVDHDACFAAAGFSDLGDTDEVWDAEFAELVETTVAVLGGIGKPVLTEGESSSSRGGTGRGRGPCR
jgi:hypothetical protein